MIGTILIFLLILSLLVFVHEFGHFFVAKRMGMQVDEFGFGFPPRILGVKKGKTLYSINAIPLGGFVRIKGESGASRGDKDSFASNTLMNRFLVLIAGVVMNIVLAAALFSIGFAIGLPGVIDDSLSSSADVQEAKVQVMSVLDDSPAANAGVLLGDELIAVDGEVIATADQARGLLAQRGEEGVSLEVRHTDGAVQTVSVTAEELPEAGIVGIGTGIVTTGIISYPIHEAIANGVAETVTFTVEVVKAFAELLRNLVVEQKVGIDLSGPVGIAVITGEVASLGFVYLLQFAALLSINLAVLNVLPFPALDGGRILFLIIEGIRRKPVDERIEAVVHNFGFLLLMALVVLVTYRDVIKYGGDFFGNLLS